MRLAVRAHDLSPKKNDEYGVALEAKAHSFDSVQLVCYKSIDGIRRVPGGMGGAAAKRIGDAFRQNGVGIELIGAYFNPVHSNAQKVADDMAVFADYLSAANELGCPVVASETGSRNDEPWVYHPDNRTDESQKRVVRVFKELCRVGEKCGASVAIEGAAGHVCWNVAALKRVYDEIAMDNLKIVFDLFNFLDKENCRDYYDILSEGLETFGSAVYCFHMKDCVFTPDGPVQAPLGLGELDFDRIIGTIRRFDENAALVMEGTTGPDIPFAAEFIKTKWKEAAI